MSVIRPEDDLNTVLTSDRFKVVLTSTAVGAGVIAGSWFLLFVLPIMWFTSGVNDSSPEILGGAALLLSMLPASVLAGYSRLWAGVWLTVVGVYFAIAAPWNAYLVSASHGLRLGFFEIIGNGFLGWIAIALGLFFWVTGALRWPNLWGRKRLT